MKIEGIIALTLAGLLFGLATGYFAARKKGKGYFAVSASAAILAVWLSFASLLSLNWPNLVLAWILRSDPTKVLSSTQPNMATVSIGGLVACFMTWLIYRLADAEIRSGRLASNASALEIEEPGRQVSLLQLAAAHIRFRFAGKIDRPLSNPGEDPYKLPEVAKTVDWSTLAADLLCQLEPQLQRESFSHVSEKKFFQLTKSDVLKNEAPETWTIYPASEFSTDESIMAAFGALDLSERTDVRLVACLKSGTPQDRTISGVSDTPIRILSEATLIEQTLDFSEYVSSLIRRFELRAIPGTEYSLADCFSPPHVTEISSFSDQSGLRGKASGHEEALLPILDAWSMRPGVDHISIVGEFGQGKSTAVLAFCRNWARRWLEGIRDERIPLLIELRGKSPRRQAPDRFLAEWGDRYGLRGDALMSLVQSGRATLIFEGFDEVQDAGLRLDRFEQFRALWAFSYPGVKIIFTGRPNFFLDTSEREKLLRSNQSARDAGLANSRVLSLSFLDIPAISHVLRHYSSTARDEIMRQCEIDPAFLDIAKRPSMLPVIGNQWDRIRSELEEKGGITSAAIIKYFIDFLYARKEADQDRLGEYQLLHRDVRHYFTQHVAWRMVKSDLKNTIDQDGFVAAIEDGYRNLDAEFRIERENNPEIASSISRMTERFRDRPHSEIIAAITTDVRTNGLFAPDPASGRDNLYFPHKQYFEFSLAEVFLGFAFPKHKLSWTKRLSSSEILLSIRKEPILLFFASGMIPEATLSDPPVRFRAPGPLLFFNAIFNEPYLQIMKIYFLIINNAPKFRAYLALQLCPTEFKGYMSGNLNSANINRASLIVISAMATALTTRLISREIPDSSDDASIIRGVLEIISFGGSGEIGPEFYVFLASVLALMLVTLPFAIAFARISIYGILGSLSGIFVLMELYRKGSVYRAINSGGSRANAALICGISSNLPARALSLRPEIVSAAFEELGVDRQIFEQIA